MAPRQMCEVSRDLFVSLFSVSEFQTYTIPPCNFVMQYYKN